MYAYRTPGVWFEWLDPARVAVQPVRTDIAGFVGIARRGPLHDPRRVESWTQFTSTFGGHMPEGFLAYAVEGFFANGGQTCWVVRVADAETAASARIDLHDSQGRPAIRLHALSKGTWAHELLVTVVRTGPGRFSLALRMPEGTQELWPGLATDTMHERYAISVLNAGVTGSRLISAEDLRPELQLADGTQGRSFADPLNAFGRMAGGADGLVSLRPEHLSGSGGTPDQPWGLAALEEVDEISVVAIPDVMPKPRVVIRHRGRDPRCGSPADTRVAASSEVVGEPPPAFDGQQVAALQSDLVAHCERLRDRVAILDVPGTVATPDDVPGWRRNLDTKYAAAYYPWLRVLDPLRLDGLTRDIPACGHVAGVYARGDLTVGVHKPPANEIVEGAADIVGGNAIDDVRHGDLNEIGVNVIRAQGGRGVRVAGARTLSSESEWRFVNVRRLVIMIEEAIDEQIQWSVFEPSDQNLWRDLDRVIRSFLLGLWQRGMLEGATASEAFFVTCDETTNLPGETDLGRITCLVGLQPPWPAEFVVIRIGRTESSTEFVELIGGGRA